MRFNFILKIELRILFGPFYIFYVVEYQKGSEIYTPEAPGKYKINSKRVSQNQ